MDQRMVAWLLSVGHHSVECIATFLLKSRNSLDRLLSLMLSNF